MESRSIGDRLRAWFVRDDLIAFGSGLVFAASTPPIDFTPGILLGLGLFAFARPSRKRGFLFGLAANLEALRFVPDVIARFTSLPMPLGWLALVLLSAAQAIPWMLGGWLTRRLVEKRGLPRALAFAIGVYGATLVPALFPWTPAGGLSGWPILLQAAEAVGERGVSMVLALGCALFATRSWALGGATFAVVLGYGALRMHTIDAARAAAPHAKVALIEPDFDAFLPTESGGGPKMMSRLAHLTQTAEAQGAELTVWPESAYPYPLPYAVSHSPYGPRAFLQRGVHGPVISGAYLSKEKGVGTNSALLVAPDGVIAPSSDKRHLLWFGETDPLAAELPILRRIFARGAGLDAGTEVVLLDSGAIRANVLNCYEDTLPVAGREAMTVRPNLLVNVTNDAWFAGTAESELHLRTAVPRAIEERRDLVRAVNRGPTTFVDANGRIVARTESPPGSGPPPPLVVDAALLEAPITLYGRAGEAPLSILLLATALGVAFRHKTQNGRRSAKAAPASYLNFALWRPPSTRRLQISG